MKTKINTLLIIMSLLITTILIITYSKEVMESVAFSISIWQDNLLPSLFPFFIISELLINYGFIELLGVFSNRLMNKAFHLPGEASFVIIGSLISGFPSSSKYINELLSQNKINQKEAEYLLKFNHFSNPLFVIGTVGILLLNNKKLGYIILFIHILSNFIIALIFRNRTSNFVDKKTSIVEGINYAYKKRISNNYSFIEVLTSSIFKTFKTLLLLLGIITVFSVISTIVKELLPVNDLEYSIISGLLEMTSGIKNISNINIPINLKSSIISFFISFGGLSIHMQVMSILSNKKIKYLPYLLSRILHALISSSITYIVLSFIQYQ